MTQPLPPGQGPVDPRGAFSMPPVPGPAPIPGSMMIMPPPYPPPRRRVGVWILLAVLILALGMSLLVNLAQLGMNLAQMSAASMHVRQTVISGQGLDKVAVVPIDGLIDNANAQSFDLLLKDVEKDSSVKALVVEIDTPGGSATAADEMYHRLMGFKAKRPMPVVIAMRGMATSGGYYVACAGDYLFAEPSTLTGNIGVIFPRFNVSQMLGKWGVEETTLTATPPPGVRSYKDAGSMFRPENQKDTEYLQGLVDGTFLRFKDVVLAGRKGRLSDKAGDVFSGKAFIAQEALDRGLIDQIGYPDKAYDYAASTAGLTSKQVVRYSPNPSLLQLLAAQATVPAGQARGAGPGISVNGINVDARTVEELWSSRPLLLWRGN